MLIGIDDTDSPEGMCTTYLGALLARRLIHAHMQVREARLVRLNPNVTYKTRGNAAVALAVDGDSNRAFAEACGVVEELADFACANTNPGVVVMDHIPGPAFYRKAVTDFCTIEEATGVLDSAGALYQGYKNRRGLIGATAAVTCNFPDKTYEILAYRKEEQWGTPRTVDRASLLAAQQATFPHTWDSVDEANNVVVCVPHTPDPVLFGIRGESPSWVMFARSMIGSEKPALEQIWITNQGTDAHIIAGKIGGLREGLSYQVGGLVGTEPVTGPGGHVSFVLTRGDHSVRCMAYEPTKNFRQVVRRLITGDRIIAVGSYKKGSINLEKLHVVALAQQIVSRPPVCTTCKRRMTSNGKGKGFKCRRCGTREMALDSRVIPRTLNTGWYEVPPTARRHLAKPLCRGAPRD